MNPKKKKEGQNMVGTDNSSIKTMIAALSSHDDGERVRARHALMAMGKAACPSLVEVLKEGEDHARWEAVKALDEIGDPATAPALVKALKDEMFDVRWMAAEGLIRMNIKGLKPLLQALIDQGESDLLREGAHHVIHDLAKGELKKYLAPVLAALEDIAPRVEAPVAAYHALEMLEKTKIC
ncbi:MAG TPA: HEAT repeat domain-containing protein [Thermodesulfobacteriota bacterium]|nr:HEAT repeat domain-containing protein [Thermodesulfobacteriota bacterium]